MKKLLLCAVMVGVGLTSCVNEERHAVQNRGEQKITFDSPVMYSNENTRANVYGEIGSQTENGVTYTYPTAEQFVIYAISHAADFSGWDDGTATAFNGTAIEYDYMVDGWAPKTVDDKYYYWESGKKMSFAACSPADLEQAHWGGVDKRTYGAEGLQILDFAISTDASKQFDLLFSTRSCNQTAADMNHSASYYSGLPVKFQHALSSIRFSIANSSDESVVLTGITVGGVKYKGDFNENITEDSVDPTLYDREATGNVAPEWTVKSDIIASEYVAFNGNIQFVAEPRYVSQLVEQAADPANICNQLLLMPQELTDAATVTVHYTVNGNVNHKTVNLKGLKSSKDVNGEMVETGSINSWEMGKRYTYRLYYSSATADKDKIYFAPSTGEWEDVDVIIVAL